MKIQSKLIGFNIEPCEFNSSLNIKKYRFNISHNNGKTTLDQDIELIKNEYGNYIPKIFIEEFDRDFNFNNSKDAMLKYSDWLMRLGVALKVEANRGKFSKIEI